MSGFEVAARDRRGVPAPGMTVFGFLAAALFLASSSAPTPIYHLYQDALGLSPLTLTVIFAAYAISLLGALLTVGGLSDHVGRRPVIFAALMLNAAALVLFLWAETAAMLIAARCVQGMAVGSATAALGAAILDSDRARGPLLNSITAFVGLAAGSLGSGTLVAFAPDPMRLVFELLLGATLVLAALTWAMPETTSGKPGALASLRPDLHVPARARPALLGIAPVNVAGWALGGFYFSLMPSLVRAATGLQSPFIGGVVVAVLPLTATLAVLGLREVGAERLLRICAYALVAGVSITLAGVASHRVALMLLGAVVAGIGFGTVLSGTMRTLLPLAGEHERAGLLSAYYVGGYLAFSLPSLLVGLLASRIGLPAAGALYGAVVIVLALISLATMSRPR
ncbi:MAG: MFS transporter [Amaricoccus sp.]